MSFKIIEQPTLGQQPVVLGGLYSVVHNEYLPVMKLWSTLDVNKNKEVIYHPHQYSKWTSEQSATEKQELLGIDVGGSLTVDLKSSKVKAGGSFQYLSEKKVVVKV